MSGLGLLLLRRGGLLWGVANTAVEGLVRGEGGFRISLGGPAADTALRADEVLGVVEGLPVRPAAPALRRFWPERAAGVAVYGREPLVVIDPGRPPALLQWLRPDEGGDC